MAPIAHAVIIGFTLSVATHLDPDYWLQRVQAAIHE